MVLMTVSDRAGNLVSQDVMDEHESAYQAETASYHGYIVDIRQLSKEEVRSVSQPIDPLLADLINFFKGLAS
jgi:hypothetical protein